MKMLKKIVQTFLISNAEKSHLDRTAFMYQTKFRTNAFRSEFHKHNNQSYYKINKTAYLQDQ